MRPEDRKIMELRKAKKVSQVSLAAALHTHQLHIVKVEKGRAQYSNETLELARAFFEIEGMPLSKLECKAAKERLYIMRGYTRDGRLDEARSLCNEMAKIVNLEICDDELPMLYRIYETMLLLAERDIDAAEAKLNHLQGCMGDMNPEHRYYFYCSMGVLSILRVRYDEALEFCKKAQELSEFLRDYTPHESARLHVLIALCYSHLELPYHAIFYIHKNRDLYSERGIDKLSLTSDLILALNYIYINNLNEAEKLLNSCLPRIMSMKDNINIGLTMKYYGVLYMKKEDWQRAIQYLDQALEYYEKGSVQYLWVLYIKIRCIAGNRTFAKAKKLLEATKPLCGTNDVIATYFEALGHYVTLSSRISLYNDPSVVEYLETVAIPYFKQTCGYFEAIDYYRLLESYYLIKNNKKSLLMAVEISKIYERCLFH